VGSLLLCMQLVYLKTLACKTPQMEGM
jgi:hypothetical protein